LGSLLQLNGNLLISLVGAALVAVLFQPLREILQRAVNRLMYGERDEPYRVIARLGQRLENTLEPRETLTTIVETVAQALKAPYVAVLLKDGRTEEFSLGAAYGQPWRSEPPLVVPLTYRAENVGQLWLAPRSPRESYSPTDHRLLSALANQAGAALHAVQLTAVLQRQRERLVTAREEERRRVSRDLHDGFGPTMAGITLQIGVARSLIGANPAAAEKLLDELKRQTQGANADIRQLVYALRPPELDLGLFSALRSTATRYNQPGGMNVELDIPESCPPLPAAIEVAAYRIAQEALTNAIRHAGASKCWLRLELIPPALPGAVLAGLDKTFPALEGFTSNILQLEIVDDGCGLPAGFKPGVGLNSMRERAEELGGTCSFESRAEGGMRVLARLPFSPEEPGKE
jgi:signal transduction histidine kinase